jgi:hypothetical protein
LAESVLLGETTEAGNSGSRQVTARLSVRLSVAITLAQLPGGGSNSSAGNQPWKAASVLILPSRVQPLRKGTDLAMAKAFLLNTPLSGCAGADYLAEREIYC